ncbi:hypothetical protein BGZ49_001660 [Haplosporangium sp. Z 27]|nr:hypothetical protein BGZ49_001660 [Haplosporangium sp. Z 27]
MILSSYPIHSLAVAILVTMAKVSQLTDAMPQIAAVAHPMNDLQALATNENLGKLILPKSEDQGVINMTKRSKQPSTPPSSLPSDRFADYKYEKKFDLSSFHSTSKSRTIIIGDVHGSLEGLERLLTHLNFNTDVDNLILAGDMVSKGPDSLQVIDKVRSINAKCVRGNHDDHVIRWKGYLDSLTPSQRKSLNLDDDSSIPSDLVGSSEPYHIAKSLSVEQYQYLLSCPLMLSLPSEMSVHKLPIYVMHAGINPETKLDDQQPWVLVNIRNVLKSGVPSRKKGKGHGWAKEFNKWQSKRTSKGDPGFMIVYGHDAGRSLNVKKWSVGVDTGCVYGRELTGYIVETAEIVSVPCPNLGADS